METNYDKYPETIIKTEKKEAFEGIEFLDFFRSLSTKKNHILVPSSAHH